MKKEKLSPRAAFAKDVIRKTMGMTKKPITPEFVAQYFRISQKTAQRILSELEVEPPIDWRATVGRGAIGFCPRNVPGHAAFCGCQR